MDVPRILAVRALEGKKLLVRFVNGVEKVYDSNPLLSLERFNLLKNEAFFRAVRVDPGGYGISWNDEMDLSEYELWTNGMEVKEDDTTGMPISGCHAEVRQT
jgi:hypothetical protein